MDKRPIIGLILIGVLLLSWMMWMMPKEEKRKMKKVTKREKIEIKEIKKEKKYTKKEDFTVVKDTLENEVFRLVFTRKGGGIESVRLKKFLNPKKEWVELVPEGGKILCGEIGRRKLEEEEFTLKEIGENYIVYEAEGITKKYEITPNSYVITLYIFSSKEEKCKLEWNSGMKSTEKYKDLEIRYFGGVVKIGDATIFRGLNKIDTSLSGEIGDIEWVGLKNKYFLGAIVPMGKTEAYFMRRFSIKKVGGGCMRGCVPSDVKEEDLRVGIGIENQRNQQHKFKIYIGPLDYELLRKTKLGIEDACYFGFKWIRPISRLFLKILIALHKIIPNYGVVIIVFSFMLSILLFPLTKTSYSSMKRMQKLQPKIQELQKKYAKDPKRLNKETMELYRKYKVNPFSGCLPLVIQLPIFIALYALLDTTIALRGAVFIPKWIEDLSHPDPYFILPLLMGGVMFLQQKLQYKTQTPSEQRMMMYFMPLFLTFIFLRFPSGLVLYYFMYNVFSFLGTGVMKKIEKGGRK